MQGNKLDFGPSTSILTLLICLQWSDKYFGRGDVSRDVTKNYEKLAVGGECIIFSYDKL